MRDRSVIFYYTTFCALCKGIRAFFYRKLTSKLFVNIIYIIFSEDKRDLSLSPVIAAAGYAAGYLITYKNAGISGKYCIFD